MSNENSKQNKVVKELKIIQKIVYDGVHPKKLALFYHRDLISFFGFSPIKNKCGILSPTALLTFALITVNCLTTACHLYVSRCSFIEFGDDLVLVIGLCMVYLKLVNFVCQADEIDFVPKIFQKWHNVYVNFSNHGKEIRQLQRKYYLFEIYFYAFTLITIFTLFLAFSIQPYAANQPFPLAAVFPFELHDPVKHPFAVKLIYGYQCVCLFINFLILLQMDLTASNVVNQTSLNLKILCVRIRNLKSYKHNLIPLHKLHDLIRFHQDVNSITDVINNCFYWHYVVQMGASTFIICLTAFETLLVKDQPILAIKFIMYMFAAFVELFYLCWMGNKVYFDSLEVAKAAFELHQWYRQTPVFQRDLMFMIKRAQKPLIFRARPLIGFNFQTFLRITQMSYSYFTLLRTINK